MLAVVPTCSSAQAAGSPSLAGTSAVALDLIRLMLLIVVGLSRVLGVHATHQCRGCPTIAVDSVKWRG